MFAVKLLEIEAMAFRSICSRHDVIFMGFVIGERSVTILSRSSPCSHVPKCQ